MVGRFGVLPDPLAHRHRNASEANLPSVGALYIKSGAGVWTPDPYDSGKLGLACLWTAARANRPFS